MLGIGRQGVDVLLIRLAAASMALVAGAWIQQAARTHTLPCTGVQACAQLLITDVIVLGLLGTLLLALVAFPTTIVWGRGLSGLKPELPWQSLQMPGRWWQWGLLALGVIIVLGLLWSLMQIPLP